jgi:tetratricopeptide (TPR) repeat protein
LETATAMPPGTGFPTREVASLLGVSESRLRTWVRAGFVRPARGPGKRLVFDFQDLVVLRAARDLLDQGVPLRRVRRALDRLRASLPADRSLTELRLRAEGGEVVVEEAGRAWEPASGQRLLPLDPARREVAVPAAVEPPAEHEAPGRRGSGEEWYELGLELESASPDDAAKAYRRALELEPELTGAYLNLGRLLHEQGDLIAAETLYRQALAGCEPEATAAFNLGVVLQDGERWAEAGEAYRRALELEPDYADAYYNLASVYEALGDRTIALQNLQQYRRLTRR